MEQYKQEFIEFMVESNVLKFGDFTLKSGRKSPFFMNAGSYVTGGQLKKLGEYYAKAIHDNFGDDFDVLFGPAYKGIPLSVTTAIAFHELYGKEIKYCSNRKEEKDHGGDAGILLGSPIKDGDRVVIIEDVTTSGKSIEETFPIIKAQGNVEILGLMVSLNRMEKGKGDKGALDEIQETYGFNAAAIVSMAEVIEHLHNREYKVNLPDGQREDPLGGEGKIIIDDTIKEAIEAYYQIYGVK
ncbi:orotate phosphoribosyltransferase [Lacrimispora sp.]|uniref:orotate phosphoribosyltransferase n=1 Tax=Lacrimispora sp. TaxID=2719234 RepID=UPI00346132CA